FAYAGRWSRGSCAYESLLGSSDGGTFNYDIWPENRVRPEIRVRPLFQGNRGQTPFPGKSGSDPFRKLGSDPFCSGACSHGENCSAEMALETGRLGSEPGSETLLPPGSGVRHLSEPCEPRWPQRAAHANWRRRPQKGFDRSSLEREKGPTRACGDPG